MAGVAPAWTVSPRDRPTTTAAAVTPEKARTAADLPEPPKAMTLAERRAQVAKGQHELSPMRAYMNAPDRKPVGAPHSRPDPSRVQRGPAAVPPHRAAGSLAATENPTWVSAWATAYPGTLSIGGQVKLPKRGSTYSGMWLYVMDEGGAPVYQLEIKKATDDPRGDTPGIGAWCYDWWTSNSYPADQCFWWAGNELINPEGGTNNCGLCAIAGDDLLAGKNPASVPGADRILTLQEVATMAGGTFVKRNGLSAVVSDVLKWGDGARGVVFKGPRVGIGHYFNVINDQGKVVFFDFQKGRASPEGAHVYYLMRTN